MPRACVVTDGSIFEQEIKDFVKGHVADYKQLRGGVVFVDVIPKKSFREDFKEGLRELAKKGSSAKL